MIRVVIDARRCLQKSLDCPTLLMIVKKGTPQDKDPLLNNLAMAGEQSRKGKE